MTRLLLPSLLLIWGLGACTPMTTPALGEYLGTQGLRIKNNHPANPPCAGSLEATLTIRGEHYSARAAPGEQVVTQAVAIYAGEPATVQARCFGKNGDLEIEGERRGRIDGRRLQPVGFNLGFVQMAPITETERIMLLVAIR